MREFMIKGIRNEQNQMNKTNLLDVFLHYNFLQNTFTEEHFS